MKHFWGLRRSDGLAATSCSILFTDATLPDNPIAYANVAFSKLCGYPLAEVVGKNCRFLQGPNTDPLVVAEIRAAVASGVGIRREILNYRKNGTTFWSDLTIDPIRDATGRLTGFIGIQHPGDAVRFATQEKAEAESRLASIADHIPGYLYRRVMRTDGRIEVVYYSPSLLKLLGIPEGEPSPSFYELVHPGDNDALIAAIRSSAADMSTFREEFRLVSASGGTHWMRSEAPPRRMPNGEIVWDGLALEVSAEKRWESEVASQALRDPLTGLLTRAAWRQALERQLNSGEDRIASCGMLYIDIAEFRHLNERLDHALCDQILHETAQRLIGAATAVGGVAARLGGDEFAILVPGCAGEKALGSLAHSTSKALALPMELDRQEIVIRTCIGASMSAYRRADKPFDKDLVGELMAQAELALRWAKQAGGSAYALYSPEQDDRFKNQTALARSLEQAIASGEMELHYQPLVHLTSGRIVSAEALVRWNHPTLGMQRPDLFIPLAEKLGLIGKLGRWVLEQAVRQHKLWQEAGLAPPPIAINVSGSQLLEPDFVAIAEESLKAAGANAGDFEIELTEGLLIEPSPQVLASLHALRSLGFSIAIDDFGSGHASFRYLRDFPVDKLKIDQTFVRKLVLESTDALIIRAIISLARNIGVALVAEGVETELQRDFLQREGCEVGQGYLFSMPLVAEDFAWLLANAVQLPMPVPSKRLTA